MRQPILLILWGLLITGLVQPVYALQASLVEISSPDPSEILSGKVPISGTAIDPNFRQYELEFAPDPPIGDIWYAIQPPVAQQVDNNVLGLWDTTFVEDGRYIIRLRLIRTDDTERVDQVRVFVANATPTPTLTFETPTLVPTLTPDTSGTIAGPTETPLIWQPPTRTPRPNPTPGGNTAPTPQTSLTEQEGPFQTERLWQAAWVGTRFTLSAFAFVGLYLLLRAIVRGGLRAVWWTFRREVVSPLLDTMRRNRRQ